jgi:putative glycosyltransferase
VYGIQKARKGNLSERLLGSIFYRIFLLLSDIDYPQNTLTARLMSKRYIQKIIDFQEKELDIWGLFVLTGFNQKGIPVDKGHKGTTTYTFRKKLRMAIDILTSFSNKPLHLIFLTGVGMLLFSLLNICLIFYQKIFYKIDVEGWASVLASIWLIGGLIVFMLGVISIYLSKMFIEIKARPLTIIKNVYQSK